MAWIFSPPDFSQEKPQFTKSDNRHLFDKSWFRLVVVGVILLVVALFTLTTSKQPADSASRARAAAESFARAFEKCDVKAITPLYYPLTASPEAVSQFHDSCKPGNRFTFLRQIDVPAAKNGKSSVGLLYNATDRNGRSDQVVLYMLYTPDLGRWQVYSVSPVTQQ